MRGLLWLANIALLAALVWLAVDGSLPAPGPGVQVVDTGRGERDGAEAHAPPPVDYAAILKRNIFQAMTSEKQEAAAAATRPRTPPPKAAPQPAPEPAWEPRLRLLGTVAASPLYSRALIEDLASGETNVYRPGETVQGATVARIERNLVVLERNDREYRLEFGLEGRAERPGPGNGSGGDDGDSSPSLGGIITGIRELSGNAFQLNREAIMAEVRRQAGSPHELFKDVRLTPYEEDGDAVGMRVTGLENVGLARIAGIEDGDVIQSINGMRLRTHQEAYQVFRSVRQQTDFKVVLLRNGQRKTYNFKLSD